MARNDSSNFASFALVVAASGEALRFIIPPTVIKIVCTVRNTFHRVVAELMSFK